MPKYDEAWSYSLAERWIEGSQLRVLEQLETHDSSLRALYTAEVAVLLLSVAGNHEMATFLRMLRSRAAE